MQERSFPLPRQSRLRVKALLQQAAAFVFILILQGIPPSPGGVRNETAPYGRIQAPVAADAAQALKKGLDSYNARRYAEALDILSGVREAESSLLGDYVLLYRGKSNFMMERHQEAVADFRLLQARYPDSPLIAQAVMDECRAFLKLGDPGSALNVLNSSKIDLNSEVLYLKGKAHQEAGEKERAIDLYMKVYSSDPGSQASALAERDLLSLSPGALSGGRNYGARLQRAENLLKAGDARKARAFLLALAQAAAPDAVSRDRRNLFFGEAEYRLGRALSALPYLRRVTGADPALHARAIYLQGACYRRLEKEESLVAARDRALKLYPESADTEELCYSVAAYFDLKNDSRALEAYRTLQRSFPGGRYAERALWKLALFPYVHKSYGEAALAFSNFLFANPRPQPAAPAMYWMGRCYEKLGDAEKARYLYARARALANDSYYGQKAREAEAGLGDAGGKTAFIPGVDFARIVRICDAIRHEPLSLPAPGQAAAPIVERASALWAADLTEFAVSELQWGSRLHPTQARALRYMMSRIFASRENHQGAISTLRILIPDYISRPVGSFPDEVRRLLFPVRYWSFVASQAERTGTDPMLILGLIRQESAFDDKARSRSNARGLMQILPSTGRTLARTERIRNYNAAKLFDPEINILLGTRHLTSLLKRYGSTELALAAYNAGSSRVDRWVSLFGKEDPAQFVEQIPFGETRNYVKQVLSNKAFYELTRSSSGGGGR